MVARETEWSRGWRLTLFWVAMLVIGFVLMPVFIVAGGGLLGFRACYRPDTAAASWICSPLGRLLVGTVLLAGAMAFFVPLVRVLQRKLNVDYGPKPSERVATTLPESLLGRTGQLSLGQRLVAGQVESCSRLAHTAVFSGFGLTFWTLFPFQRGWIRTGDSLVVVYQTIPFSTHLKFALAYWGGSASPVRGVATIAHSSSILISAALIVIVSIVPTPFPGFLMKCSLLNLAISAVYLVLMFRAKAALRAFLADAVCTL